MLGAGTYLSHCQNNVPAAHDAHLVESFDKKFTRIELKLISDNLRW